MHLAAEKGKHLRLQKRLSGNLNRLDNGKTALYLASCNGHLLCVTMLLDAKADVNCASWFGTPVMAAARYGHIDVVNALIGARADVSTLFGDSTALVEACKYRERDNHRVVAALLAAGAIVDTPGAYTSPLFLVVVSKSTQTLRLLLEARADVDVLDSLDGKVTPLQFAGNSNNTAMVRMLLEAKANVSAGGGKTLLSAASHGNVGMVDALIAAGATVTGEAVHATIVGTMDSNRAALLPWLRAAVEQHDYDAGILVYREAEADHPAVIRALVAAKADVEADSDDLTPLTTAAMLSSAESVRVLLDAGADPNGIFREKTPLDINTSAEVAALLAEAGGKSWHELMADKHTLVRAVVDDDMERVNELLAYAGEEEKEAALAVAVLCNRLAVVKRLLAAGVRASVSHAGDRVLGVASKRGCVDVVRALLDAGADMSWKNEYGFTPMQLAAQGKHRDVVALLLATAKELKKANK
jgi:ankyrin repeat protein